MCFIILESGAPTHGIMGSIKDVKIGVEDEKAKREKTLPDSVV